MKHVLFAAVLVLAFTAFIFLFAVANPFVKILIGIILVVIVALLELL